MTDSETLDHALHEIKLLREQVNTLRECIRGAITVIETANSLQVIDDLLLPRFDAALKV